MRFPKDVEEKFLAAKKNEPITFDTILRTGIILRF